MKPALADGPVTAYQGDALPVLRELPDESVHCVVTSPPYWGLRDYWTATWEGGDAACDHKAPPSGGPNPERYSTGGAEMFRKANDKAFSRDCGKCGARRIDSQLGLEATPDEYVENMVALFREVRRVLRQDGTCWLNMGDGYNAYNGGAGPSSALSQTASEQRPRLETGYGLRSKALKPKDLIGMPWRLAFALRADGWWLRSDIIWAKPNPMPESVTDRPTSAHEHIFLLTKSARYYYDQEAVREPHLPTVWSDAAKRLMPEHPDGYQRPDRGDSRNWSTSIRLYNPAGRNLRNVWEIPTEPYPEAHFATFPQEIPLRAIKAGTSEHGVCSACGAPWRRVLEISKETSTREPRGKEITSPRHDGEVWNENNGRGFMPVSTATLGWQAACTHEAPPVPATVLDPFAGSGTTLAVARRLGRRAIGIELSPDYVDLIRGRVATSALPLLETDDAEPEAAIPETQLDLFAVLGS